MIGYYLGIAALLVVACDKKEPVESLEKRGHLRDHPNPGLTPLEKPDIEEEYYEVPQLK